jgi:hypothetical protein
MQILETYPELQSIKRGFNEGRGCHYPQIKSETNKQIKPSHSDL